MHLILRIVIAIDLVASVLTADRALANDRAEDFEHFISAAYPIFLAKVGLWETSPSDREALIKAAASGLSAVAPADCDGAKFKNDFCGMSMKTEPSSSMEPNIKAEEIFMTRPYLNDGPKRGDIIVFSHQSQTEKQPTLFVKRLIAVPGDQVELRHGLISINGKNLKQVPTNNSMTDIYGNRAKIFTETNLEGRQYEIAVTDKAPPGTDDVSPFTIPAGKYFVLGDNRHNSVDSRLPNLFGGDGLVSGTDIIGQAVVIFVSREPRRAGKIIE
ncbi:signal peptidase I [Oryzifoliimicrobium ureilyticus]|uniref:signal peptidase I n=1 Tax=Oryzifoliimicrobium ureilyticus TaxID=3113724 RepID=UPI0030765759